VPRVTHRAEWSTFQPAQVVHFSTGLDTVNVIGSTLHLAIDNRPSKFASSSVRSRTCGPVVRPEPKPALAALPDSAQDAVPLLVDSSILGK
jgi:hypothetical protein